MDNRQLLLDITLDKAKIRYGNPIPQYVLDRIDLEMKTIDYLGRHDYFLIIWDIFDFCNNKDRIKDFCERHDLRIPKFGTIPITKFGRGSAGGSMILGLTIGLDYDPVEYNLFFERFLNIERVSEPDVDIDVSQEYRSYVIMYLQEKWGNTCQISTYGTMASKNVISDSLRTFGVPVPYVNALKKLVPDGSKLEDIINTDEFNNVLYQIPNIDHEFMKRCFLRLEGLRRNKSKHAGGIVMSPQRIEHNVPVWMDGDSEVMAVEMHECEEMGFLKIDLLGLRTIDVVTNCEHMADINHNDIPLDDEKTFKLLRDGDTAGIFQIEGTGFTQMMQQMEVDSFNCFIMGMALYRPGTLDATFEGKTMTDHIVDRKTGREPVTYLFPEEESYLAETYGCMLYQEQVMARVRQMTGCTYGHSDIVRRAMGKKNRELMEEQMAWFRETAMNHKFTESHMWDDEGWRKATIDRAVVEIMANCRYSFNKAHATSYGGICYNNAYFKANYPLTFYCCLLNTIQDKPDKMEYILTDIKRHNIKILPPDINISTEDFTPIGDSIAFGLSAVKGLKSSIRHILDDREKNGEYKSLMEFCLRLTGTQINKTGISALLKAGAFDNILGEYNRTEIINSIDIICKQRTNMQKKKKRKAGDFVPSIEYNLQLLADGKANVDITHIPLDRISNCLLEKDILGYYVSANPIDAYNDEINRYGVTNDKIIGFVTNIHTTTIKKEGRNFGKEMGFIEIQSRDEKFEVTVFHDIWKNDVKDRNLKNGDPIVCKVKIGEYKGNPSYSAVYVRPLVNNGIRNINEIHLYVDKIDNCILQLKEKFVDGKTDVFFHIKSGLNDVVMKIPFTIQVNDTILKEMSKIGVVRYYEI